MKKLFLMVSAIFFALSASHAQSNREIAAAFVKALSTENYTEAASYFDPAITQVNKDVLAAGWKQITGAFGSYQSYYLPKEGDANATPIVAGIRFEKSTKGFACNFNDKHQLVGFLLAPAPEEAASTAAAKTAPEFKEEEVSIAVNGGTLKGSLMLPNTMNAYTPVALIIAGSGPTDRNGNSVMTQNNSYRMLAEALAAKGIASLRYDKRMVGASNNFKTGEGDVTFADYIADAKSSIRFLQEKKKFGNVYVLGHSEGSLIGMIASKDTKVKGFVSLAGAGENISNILERQINDPAAATILAQLKKGNTVQDVPASLAVILRPSVQPFLISWMKYEPAVEIAALKIPVLLLQGTTDLQVSVTDAENLKKALPAATLSIIKGMNHLLKDAPEDKTANLATYNQPDLPLNQEAADQIVSFLSAK